MKQIRDNWPVIETLKGLGFTGIDAVEESRNIYVCVDPEGQRRNYILSKSGTTGDRHRYGVSLRSLREVDAVVFWGRHEERLFVVPASWLLGVREAQWIAQVNRNDQWVMNIRFDRQELKPTLDDDTHLLFEYAVPIPEDLRRRVSRSHRL